MKVVMVVPYFYPRIGGMEIYVYNISKLLVQKYGIEVVVICSSWEKEKYKEECIDGIKIYRLPYLFKVSTTPVNLSWQKQVQSIVNMEKPDVVNGHAPVPYLADIACRVAQKTKTPFLFTHHIDLIGYNIPLKFLSKAYFYLWGLQTLKLSQKVIVTSEYYQKSSHYVKRFANKIEIVPPGVCTETFDQIVGLVRNSKTVLFVGQLNKANRHKGLDHLMIAMQMVKETIQDVRLVVVGEGNYLSHYKMLATKLGIDSMVSFTGPVIHNELAKYYSESSVLVAPSYITEGYGMVLTEAQACGTPVIGTLVGGIPYAVKDGDTGLLVPPSDPPQLAGAILKILNDQALARKLGQAGYKRIREELTWDKSAEKTLHIYSKLKG